MKIRTPIHQQSLQTVLRVVKAFDDPSAAKAHYHLAFDLSKTSVKQLATEPPIEFQSFNLVIRRSQHGQVLLLYFGEDKLQNWNLVLGKTKIEIRLTPLNLRELEAAVKCIAACDGKDAFEGEVSIDLPNVRIIENNKNLCFPFTKFNIFIRRFRTGRCALYLSDQKTGFK